MLLTSADLNGDPRQVLSRAGWDLRVEGACVGPVCIPLQGVRTVEAVADQLGMPIVADEPSGLRALGPATVGGRALTSATAPDVELSFVFGDDVWRLASQRGRRTVIVAWAPW